MYILRENVKNIKLFPMKFSFFAFLQSLYTAWACLRNDFLRTFDSVLLLETACFLSQEIMYSKFRCSREEGSINITMINVAHVSLLTGP